LKRIQGSTPLKYAASQGHKDVVTLLLSAGASVSVVDEKVIKPSVKLRQLDIKLLQCILSSNINNNTTLYYERI
jgi:ankyrin repeat protein